MNDKKHTYLFEKALEALNMQANGIYEDDPKKVCESQILINKLESYCKAICKLMSYNEFEITLEDMDKEWIKKNLTQLLIENERK